jgi:hypothetical protein
MFAADDAEARGDAEAALALMSEMLLGPDGKPFWRPWRVRYLTQLAFLGPLLPRWVTSRWILAQALQALNEESRDRTRRALELAIEVRGGEAELPGMDDMDAMCKVIDHDWVYRQMFLYELGGLHDFLRRRASADLVAGADRIREWARAPMGAYRLLDRAADLTTWEDLATGAEIRMANIGSGALVVPEEERVIGRLVPIEGGSMFEAAPLVVTRGVAEQVAEDPAGWVDSLRAARGRLGRSVIVTSGRESGLVSDVPAVIWQYAVLDGRPIPPASALRSATAKGILELARVQLVTPVDDDPSDLDAWACLSAGLLEPGVSLALLELMEPKDRDLLQQLAERLAEPAASLCRRLDADLGQAA